MRSQIHLIRHGITEGNQRRLYYGRTDIPLAEEGIEALTKLVKEKTYPQIEDGDFYTSGMIRTEQTFSLIFGDREHKHMKELQEMGFGEFEMKSYDDLKDIPQYQTWITDKSGTLPSPGGESIRSFGERISKGFHLLMENHQEAEQEAKEKGCDAISAVVCHGGVICAIMKEQFPEEGKHFYQWIPDPGHGYTLILEQGRVVSYERF